MKIEVDNKDVMKMPKIERIKYLFKERARGLLAKLRGDGR